MKALDTGDEKVKKICEMLRSDTLKPAQDEAKGLIDKAHEEAKRIREEAEKHAQSLLESARKEIEQEKKVFDTNVAMAGKQAIETLKQRVEKEMLSSGVSGVIADALKDGKGAAQLLEALIASVKQAGLDGSLLAELPKHLQASEAVKSVIAGASVTLKEGVSIAEGIKLQVVDSNMTLDFSENALGELLFQFVREDFRDKVFA